MASLGLSALRASSSNLANMPAIVASEGDTATDIARITSQLAATSPTTRTRTRTELPGR